MKPRFFFTKSVVMLGAALGLSAGSATAALQTQLGILDLTANGGVNPATGVAWADGDTYRLIFATSAGRDATSTDIADYNAFVQGLAGVGIGHEGWGRTMREG